jgi:hypothetical protein
LTAIIPATAAAAAGAAADSRGASLARCCELCPLDRLECGDPGKREGCIDARVAHALLQTMPDLRLAVGYLAPRAGPPTGGGKGEE